MYPKGFPIVKKRNKEKVMRPIGKTNKPIHVPVLTLRDDKKSRKTCIEYKVRNEMPVTLVPESNAPTAPAANIL